MIRMLIISKKMKKLFSIFLLTILAVLTVGCERYADMQSSASIDVNVPLPIEFEILQTKAIVNDRDDIIFNDAFVFGMFAVDKDPEVGLDEDDGLNMRNQLYRYDTETNSLKFGSGGQVIYYPISERCFNFYSYYKYSDNAESTDASDDDLLSEMVLTDRSIAVVINLARPEDILYAMSESDPDLVEQYGVDGFNSAYVRKTTDIPSFYFEHPAAGVGFRVCMDETSSVPGDMEYITFANLTFNNVTTKASLCIVDKDYPENNGRFTESLATGDAAWSKGGSGNLNIPLSDSSVGDSVTGIYTDLISLGDEHFIMPQSVPLTIGYKITRIKRYYKDDGTLATSGLWTYSNTIELDPSANGGGEGFQKGKMYRYKFVVKYDNTLKYPNDITVTVLPDIV